MEGGNNSIQNQRLMLNKYAADNGFENAKEYLDAGYTGTNFNRPGFQELLADIEDGRITTVLVKDMSRLGRNYLQVGFYTEEVFPRYGVRFIAISDGVDSLYGDNDFTPFRNIINEWYTKDTRKKIRAVVKAKAQRGERVSTRAPYGYRKEKPSPDPKASKRPIHLQPDEETTPIVMRLFQMCVEGLGPKRIARALNADGIPNPTAYYFKRNGVKLTNYHPDGSNPWQHTTVAKILENPVYLGHTLNLRTTTVS